MKNNSPNINLDTTKNETAKYVVIGIVGVLVIGIVYFGIIKPILNAVGLTDDKDDRQGERAEEKLNKNQVLGTKLYTENRDKVSITSAVASSGAAKIYGGRGVLYDNEEDAMGVLTSAMTQVNISYIAQKFQDLYGKSMATYLGDGYLELENWTELENYIDKIKKF
jgi:hypothetical protein